MKLNGQAKSDFENWYMAQRASQHAKVRRDKVPSIPMFYHLLDDSMRWGVYLDFFDFKNIHIEVYKDPADEEWSVEINYYVLNSNYYKTREVARNEAIIKANELYNRMDLTPSKYKTTRL